jgi:adenine-specific DNA-methyltransferase
MRARHLLAPAGVIIVSINDNEHNRLRVLLDDGLGEENFIANAVWQGGGASLSRFHGVASITCLSTPAT